MGLTNQQRIKILQQIQTSDVRVLALSTKILDKMGIQRYVPPEIDRLLHESVNSYFIFKDHYNGIPGKDVYDGLSSCYVCEDTGERITAIGFGQTAPNAEASYLVFLLLHELSHLTTGEAEHTLLFHAMLDQYIAATNDFSGLHIVNDYCD